MDWHAIIFLGAWHGVNPGMGWLFAVALGMQQGSARGVWRALPPLALGHAAAVGATLLVAGLLQVVLPHDTLRVVVAVVLVTFGIYRLWRHRHPRFGGMQVGFRDLTMWSFLMASAHGAGLMLLPFVMTAPSVAAAGVACHVPSHGNGAMSMTAMAAGLHTLAYFIVMAGTAWIVSRKLGLSLLRRAWFNLDWAWAGALVLAGLVVLAR
jgi:uncharacterized membrane protein